MADRPAGMDHAHYGFRQITDAPRFDWPGGARIAFTITVMLDVWEIDPPEGSNRDPRVVSPLGNFFPDWLTWSKREYGARVGVFRVLELLDAFGIRPSVALGGAAAARYPELVDEFLRRGACFMAHGMFATRRISSELSEAEERALIAESRDAVRTVTGTTPAGWCGQDFNESARTPALLAEAGFTYTTDWANDDRPYLLGPYKGRTLLALPPQPEWNDLECMALRRVSAPIWSKGIIDGFRFLHDEGGAAFNLTLHPFVAGQAHRIRYLREALADVLGRRGVWLATTDEVAEAATVTLG